MRPLRSALAELLELDPLDLRLLQRGKPLELRAWIEPGSTRRILPLEAPLSDLRLVGLGRASRLSRIEVE